MGKYSDITIDNDTTRAPSDINFGPGTRSVLITGAGSGIGLACALRLDRLGWRVFAGVRDRERAEKMLSQASGKLVPVVLDVTQADQIDDATATIGERVGPLGLQGVVHCAGIVVAGPLEYVPIEALRLQLEVNVVGPMAVTQAVLPLIRTGFGRVVLIGSMSGRISAPFTGPYHASKFALEALTDSLRGELHPWRLHVSIIEPGVIATPIWRTAVLATDAMIASFPPVARVHYGPVVDAFRERALRSGATGASAETVADAVVHALVARRPRTRYLVGWDARLAALAARLPDRLRDRLLAMRYPRYGP